MLLASLLPYSPSVSLAARLLCPSGHRAGYFPSAQPPFTHIKFVAVPLSVIAPSLAKILLLSREASFSRALAVLRFTAPAVPSPTLSRAGRVHVASTLRCIAQCCALGFSAAARCFYLSACAPRLPFVQTFLKNSFKAVSPIFNLCNKQELHACKVLWSTDFHPVLLRIFFWLLVINLSSNLVQPTLWLQIY